MDKFFKEVKEHWPFLLILIFGYLIFQFDLIALWVYKIFLAILPLIGTAVLAYIAHAFWLHYVEANFISGIEWVLLEIVPPRDVIRSPKAMELFFTNALYHFSYKSGIESYWQGAVWFWFSLEIASIDGQVHFYIRAPSRVKGLIETQMYAQYPQAQVKEVEDYTLAVDKITANSKYNLWGCEFKYARPNAYPIKTYVDFGLDKDVKEEYKIDPISPVIELFGSITKGEQMWMQIVVTPSKKKFPEHGHFWQKKHNWIRESEMVVRKQLEEFTSHRDLPDKPGKYSKEIRAPGFMDEMIKGGARKFLKVGFDTGIRVCYVAKRELFNMSNRRNIRLIFRQYAAPYSNLRNKNYCFRDKQLTKKEYKQKIAELKLGNFREFEKIIEEYDNMMKNTIHRYATIIKSTDDCTGDTLENCKNVKDSFNIYDCENLKFSAFLINKNNDSYDLTISGRGGRNYDLITSAGGSFDCKFGNRATGNYLEYVDICNGENLFGCVGLKKKQYCILNRQYSKEEYINLRKKIIDHMNDMPYIDKKNRIYKYGEFFPIEISQFAYNETLAMQFFPLTKDQILTKRYKWKDSNNKDYQISIDSSELSQNIEIVNNSILEESILCGHKGDCEHGCTKGYKIIEEELKFYHKMGLPLPRYCPNCRYYFRLRRTNEWKLFYRQCMCDYKVFKNTILHSQHKEGRCLNKFETAYKNETQEIIYCKQCYQQELL